MFNQVIVVEGTHDESRIKEVYKDASCIITNGSEISEETLRMIKEAALHYQIVIFTDPDSPGERIRTRVTEIVPNALHAFIKKNKCISNNRKKVGVEHATHEDIRESLENLLTPCEMKAAITLNDLISLGLAGTASSANKRNAIADKLNIGKPNAKTFAKRVSLFGISLETLKKMVGELDE